MPGEHHVWLDGRCFVGSALKLGVLGPCGAGKGWVVDADDDGREEEEKGLKATSAVLIASVTFVQMSYRIKRWSLMTSASSITKLVDKDVCER